MPKFEIWNPNRWNGTATSVRGKSGAVPSINIRIIGELVSSRESFHAAKKVHRSLTAQEREVCRGRSASSTGAARKCAALRFS